MPLIDGINYAGGKRKAITNVGHRPAANLPAVYPLAVRISDADIGARCRADGYDLRFALQSDPWTALPAERDGFAVVGGVATGVYHVGIPAGQLVTTQDLALWCYYGNAGASQQSNPTNVWTAYKWGLHLGESSGLLHDITSSGYNGTAYNSPTYGAAGQIGLAMQLDGTDDYIEMGTQSPITGNHWTMSAWVYQSSDLTSANAWYEGTVISKGNDNAVGEFYGLSVYSPDKTTANLAANIFLTRSGGFTFYNTAAGTITANAWNLIAATCDGSVIQFYINGQPASGGGAYTRSFAAEGAHAFRVGRQDRVNPYSYPFRGRIDEPRVAITQLPAQWNAYDYLTQTGGALTWGPEQGVPGGGVRRFNPGLWTPGTNPGVM